MANKEKQSGVIDKGLSGWQKWNKITLAGELSVAGAGVVLGMPWLVPIGLGMAAVDGAQMVAINEVQKRRKKKEAKHVNLKSESKAKVINFPKQGIIYQVAA